MTVYLTNQKKLATAVGITPEHMSYLKTGAQGISDSLAEKLEETTGIKKVTWAGAARKSTQLQAALERFFKREKEMEKAALAGMATKAKTKPVSQRRVF